MSLINDALIKAERDRTEAAIAEAARLDPLSRAQKRREQRKRQSLGPILGNAAVLGAIFAALIFVVIRQRTPVAEPAAATPPVAVVERPDPADLATPALPLASPLQPATPATEPPAAVTQEYALAGMSTLGNDTLLSIVRQSDKRSVWVPVGKTVGEITAVRYDVDRDLAVIRVGGRHLTIRMGSSAMPSE